MDQPAGILPNDRPCGPTIYLTLPKPSAKICHNFTKPAYTYPTLSTIDGRLFYSYGEGGIDAIDVFCDSVIFIPYHLNRTYGRAFVQITNDTFIYQVNNKVLKIRVDLNTQRMETVDEKCIERLHGCSERIVGDRYIVYQRSASNEFVTLYLFHIDDIHEPLQSFRLNVNTERHFFGLFHIFDEKLYFFSNFDHQNTNIDRTILNLGAIHAYDMKTGRKTVHTTSTLPPFHYSPPTNSVRVQRLFIQCAFWVDTQLFVRIKEIENQCPIYHLIVLDIETLQWCLIADVDIELKLSALIDQNGIMTLVNFRPDNKEHTFYRIALRQPESLRNLAQFAVKRNFPHLYKMNLDERAFNCLPPNLPFYPIVGHEDNIKYYKANSLKMRLASLFRRIFTH